MQIPYLHMNKKFNARAVPMNKTFNASTVSQVQSCRMACTKLTILAYHIIQHHSCWWLCIVLWQPQSIAFTTKEHDVARRSCTRKIQRKGSFLGVFIGAMHVYFLFQQPMSMSSYPSENRRRIWFTVSSIRFVILPLHLMENWGNVEHAPRASVSVKNVMPNCRIRLTRKQM
jgi:hypothetical protein